jgi:hypothetical protein
MECANVKIAVIIIIIIITTFSFRWSWDGLVSTVDRLRTGQSGVRILARETIVFFSKVSRPAVWPQPASHLMGSGGLFPGGKAAGACI